MPGVLKILRGLPGSGKTSFAHEYFKQEFDAGNMNVMIVSRDDLRAMQGLSPAPTDYENKVTLMHETLVRMGLRKGMTVIISDCNLRTQYVKQIASIGVKCGAEIEVIDFDIPLAECIMRDKNRAAEGKHVVGEAVIRSMHKRYFADGKFPANPLINVPSGVKLLPYERDTSKPKVKIYDVDGTLMNHEGKRSPYDYTMVHLDEPHEDVVQQMRDDYALGYDLVVLSGREDSCREATEESLRIHTQLPVGYEIPVFMRKTGDDRSDFVVKYELFMQNVASHANVVAVYDDRNQVVEMWREIGLRCYHVAPGDF